MIETVQTYFYFLPFYPLVVIAYAVEMEILLYLVGWLVIGAAIAYPIYRFTSIYLFLIWVSIWFMPGTIICGSATMVPWASTIIWAFNEGSCTNAFSLAFSLTVNIILVFGFRYLYVKFKHRKAIA